MGKGKSKKQKQQRNQQQPINEPEPKEEQDQQQEEDKVIVMQPKKVQYCPVCTLPFEFCKYGKKAKECKKLLQEIAPGKVSKYHPDSSQQPNKSQDKQQEVVEQKKEKQGKKDKSLKQKYVVISVKERTRKKFVTNVSGLQNFKIQAKEMSKKLSKKFACSCSASNSNEVQVQGDFEEDIRDMLKQDYGVKKKYILGKDQFKQKQAEEKQKKKSQKNAEKMVIKEEPEEEEKKEEQQEQAKPKFRTQFQEALANVSDDDQEY